MNKYLIDLPSVELHRVYQEVLGIERMGRVSWPSSFPGRGNDDGGHMHKGKGAARLLSRKWIQV